MRGTGVMEDSRIIDLFFARDESAIAETSHKYERYCGTIAYNILHNQEDKEECVNETWWRAWNAIPPARPDILSAFLGRITRNLALHMYDKKHAQKRGEGETSAQLDELSEMLASATSTEKEAILNVEGTDLAVFMKHFVAGLSEETRVIFVRRYWYMDSVKEIALRLDCDEGKVKMSLFRTRKKLAEQLKKEGFIS